MADRAARRVLEAWTDRLRPAETSLAYARWEAACDASSANRERVESEARHLDELLHDETGIGKVEQSLREPLHDPLLRRALERMRLRLLPYRTPRPEKLIALDAEVQERFATFRATVGDRRLAAHEVAETLRGSRDADELEATWRAAIAIGEELEDAVREMARLRNQHAREVGAPDFRGLHLESEEVHPSTLETFLAELEAGTNAAWADEKARLDERLAAHLGLAAKDLAPWHYGDVFLQTLPAASSRGDPLKDADPVALTRATFEGIGLSIEAPLANSDLFPREGKNQHAFCTHLDRAGDVRVLANVDPSERWMRTMLHEFGHAAYDRHLDFELPWSLVCSPHACVTEGVAMLFGRLVDDPAWRREVAGLPDDPEAGERQRASLLAFVRWGLVMSRFEERLYQDPDQDLDAVWWGLVERIQGISRPPRAPRAAWAAKIHIACWPIYYHSYLFGECVASQLQDHIRREVFGRRLVKNPAAGAFLRDRVFHPGAEPRWDRLVEEATGTPLRASSLLAAIVPTPRTA